MQKPPYKRWNVVLVTLLATIWGILATYWAYPSIFDRLYIYEQTQNYGKASQLLAQMLEKGYLPSSERLTQLADLYLSSGDTKKVEELILQHGLSKSYWAKVIENYRNQLDHPNLLRVLLEQQRQGTPNPAVREEIARLYLAQKNDEQAIEQLQIGIQQHPEELIFYELLSQIYFRLGQEENAFRVYHQRATYFNTADLWDHLSEAYFWKGNTTQGEAALLKAIDKSPTFKRLARLAQFYRTQNHSTQSLHYYQQAITTFEKASVTTNEEKLLAIQIYDYLKQNAEVSPLFQQVALSDIPQEQRPVFFYIALRASDHETADVLFQLLSQTPQDNLLQIQMDYAIFTKDPQRLSQALEQLDAQDQATPAHWQTLIAMYFGQNRPKAIQALIQKKNLDLNLWKSLGNHYFDQQDVPSGLAAHLQYAQQMNTLDAWKELVDLYFFKQQDMEGLAIFRQEIAEKQDQASLWKELADLYFWKNYPTEGETTLKLAIDKEANIEWIQQLVQFYENSKRLKEAEQWYQKIISFHPSSKEGTLNLIRFYIRQGQLSQASPLMWELYQKGQDASPSQLFTISETLEALKLYLWDSRTDWIFQTLETFPLEQLPTSDLPTYFDLAFFEKEYPLAQAILNTWRHHPSPDYWQKVASFAQQSALEAELETQFLEHLRTSGDLEQMVRMAQFYEYQKNREQAEVLYQGASRLYSEPKDGVLKLIQFYVRIGWLPQAVPLMQSAQTEFEFTPNEQMDALNLYLWTSNVDSGLNTLLQTPTVILPKENLQIYFDLAVFGGALDKAESILERWRDVAPDQAWEKSMDFAILQGQMRQAIDLVEDKMESDGETIEHLRQLYTLYESEQDLEGQIATAEKMLLLQPDNPQWLTPVINYYQFHQTYGRAADFLGKLMELEPTPLVRKNLTWALLAQQDGEAAKAILTAVPSEQWDEDFEQYALDVGYMTQDLPLLAEHLEKRYKRHRDLDHLYVLVEVLRVMNHGSLEMHYLKELLKRKPNFDNRAHYVDRLYRSDEIKLAQKELATLNKDAKTADQVKTIAELAEKLQDRILIPDAYRRILQWEPDNAQILKNYGWFFVDNKQYSEAIPLFERYLENHSNDLEILQAVAELYPLADLPTKQQAFYSKMNRRFAEKSPLSLPEKRLYAFSLTKTNNPTTAISLYQEIVASLPQQTFEPYVYLLFEEKAYDAVLQELAKDYADVLNRNAYFQLKSASQKALKQKLESLKTLQQWVQVSPTHEPAWIDLGYAFLDTHNESQAFEAFEKARQLANP